MKRIFLGAVVLCLALGVGWFLSKENPDSSSQSEKPHAAVTNTPSAQTQQPANTTDDATPSQTQTSRASAPAPNVSRIAASNTTTTPIHKPHVPGDGLPPASQEQIRNLIKQAIALEDKGDLPGAIDANKKVLSIDPHAAVTMNVIAGLYGKMNDFEQEIQWSRKAITTDAGFADAYINYGNALGSTGRPRAAKQAFLKAIELEPKSPLGVYSLGVLAENRKDYKTALQYYQKSVALDPQFENGYYNSAVMYSNLQQYDKALTSLDEVIKLNPGAEDARAMTAEIITKQVMAQHTPKQKTVLTKTQHKTHRKLLVKAHHRKHRRHKAVARRS